jgi:hypothetical protein
MTVFVTKKTYFSSWTVALPCWGGGDVTSGNLRGCADSNVAIGGASDVRQVERYLPNKEKHPHFQVGEYVVRFVLLYRNKLA